MDVNFYKDIFSSFPFINDQYKNILENYLEIKSGIKGYPKDITWVKNKELKSRYQYLFNLLWPNDILGGEKIRIGSSGDGGYVMLDSGHDGVAISLGLGTGISWDMHLLNNGWSVIQFDGSLTQSPCEHRHLSFYPKYIVSGTQTAENEITLYDALNILPSENNIALRIDRPGSEYVFFEHASARELNRFSQIIGTFHYLHDLATLEQKIRIFEKICQTHVPIHFHYNNNGFLLGFDNFIVSSIFEVSFARKDIGIFLPSNLSFPTELDAPNAGYYPEIHIGKFADITGYSSQTVPPPDYFLENNLPPRYMPPDIVPMFTSDGKIPVHDLYLFEPPSSPIVITTDDYTTTIEAVKERNLDYFGSTFNFILEALKDFPVAKKMSCGRIDWLQL